MPPNQPPYARFDAPPPRQPRVPRAAAVILTAGVVAATAILIGAVRDSAPPTPAGQVIQTPTTAASPGAPNGR